ncbi:Peptide chain release factor 1, mitochondrial [Ceratocystis pirilliformis]|uniref:Peptide chain release factor 1, mitochondrial n=1 Tax=Ceratocystis pirilliformis TaxID=259994 RepID=A0ABR3ZAZ0_9PEZI
MLSLRWLRAAVQTARQPRRGLFVPTIRWASNSPLLAGASLPPALLLRAQTLSAEYVQLKAQLDSDFSTGTAKRIGELASAVHALEKWEAAKLAVSELEGLLRSQDVELRQMAGDELVATHEQLAHQTHKLTEALTPKHPFASMPCLIEFRPGPGGMEGRFFADSLFRMYKQYLDNKGMAVRVVKYETSDNAGDSTGADGELPLQEAILEVADEGAYDLLRGEAGMHRVQRIPVTESKGRTHTSAVAVWVLPSFPENNTAGEENWDNPESDFYIDTEEVRLEVMRARGAGGQHVNKTESAVRLTHVPTGTVVAIQDSRSQQRNKESAWRLLRSRVAQQRREIREEQAYALRNSVIAKDKMTRADKIRTYNYGQDRCTDHRSGLDVHNLPNVLEGGEMLGKIIDSVREWLVARDIRAMMADEEAKVTVENKKGSKL